MRSGLGLAAALVLLAGAALFLRLPDAGNRPFHADEAVHAFKLWDLRARGDYSYDPDEFHGPTLYYAALSILAMRQRQAFGDVTEADCRLPVIVIGAGLILLLALLSDGMGRRAAVAAGALIAASPAFVFYSRYFIQETLLICFTLGMIGCSWRWTRARSLAWPICAGAFAGLMVATKETAILSLAAWALALAVVRERCTSEKSRLASARKWAVAGLAAAVVAALLLTGMGRHPEAIADYFRSYAPWLHRARGTDLHRHPWTYYISMLAWHRSAGGPIWTEALMLGLAVLGAMASFVGNRGPQALLGRRLLVFTVALTLVYSLVPYKTPWCVLNLLLGMALCAGIGVAWLLRRSRHTMVRGTLCIALALALGQLTWQAYRTSFVYQVDPRNPYVYAQTVPDAEDVQRRAEALAAVHPDRFGMVVKVFWSDPYYWPIPWYLRRFPNVGYWRGVPRNADAPLIFAAPEFDEELTRRLDPTHLMNGYVGLRPRTVAMVWVRMDLWTKYIESRQRQE